MVYMTTYGYNVTVYKTTRYLVVVPVVVYLVIYSRRLRWGVTVIGINEQVACMGTWIGVIVCTHL